MKSMCFALAWFMCSITLSEGAVTTTTPQRVLITTDEAAEKLLTNKYINDENRKEAAEYSKKMQETITSIRGGSEAFYRDLLSALKIKMCESQRDDDSPPMQRFVNTNTSFAYKDENGGCIKIETPSFTTKQQYDLNLCEVVPNCYWGIISDNDIERFPVYSLSETPQAPESAMSLEEATAILQDWATGLALFVAPGIVMGLLSALTFVLFIYGRFFRNKCGGRRPRPTGYSCKEKLLPVIVFVLATGGIAVVAGISLLYNETITSSVTGVFDVSTDTLNSTNYWIHRAQEPLVNIRNNVLGAFDDIKDRLKNTDFIEGGLDTLTGKLDAFGTNTADVTLPLGCSLDTAGEICIPCDVCTKISTNIKDTNGQIKELASSGLEDFAAVRKTLNTEMASTGEAIKVNVNDKVSSTDILIDTIDRSKLSLIEVREVWDSQDSLRQVAVLGMFSLTIIVILVATAGIVFKYTPLKRFGVIHIAYIFGFIALAIGFMLAAAMMALSILLGDTCAIARIMADDWTPALGTSAATGLNACFQNQSLLDAFNLTSSLEFADQLDFPDNGNVADMFDFTKLQEFAGEINGTDATTFDTSLLDTYLTFLNKLTSTNQSFPTPCILTDDDYTVELIDAPWDANEDDDPVSSVEEYIRDRYSKTGSNSGNVATCAIDTDLCHRDQTLCTFEEVVWEVYSNITALRNVKVDAISFIADMKTNMTEVTSFIAAFKKDVVDLDASIDVIKNSTTSSLVKNVNDFKDRMYCTFVAENFEELHGYMCIDLMPALAMIALMIFLMGMFLIPVNICIIILAKRLRSGGSRTDSEKLQDTKKDIKMSKRDKKNLKWEPKNRNIIHPSFEY